MKDFTLYQEAFALKELGFDEAISTYYSFPDNELSYVMDGHNKVSVRRNSQFGYAVSAPTYAQAFRFFREKYDLDIDISRNDQVMIDYVERKGEKYLPKYKYGYSNGTFISIGTCMKYEEAELACLKKLIEIVKQRQP